MCFSTLFGLGKFVFAFKEILFSLFNSKEVKKYDIVL